MAAPLNFGISRLAMAALLTGLILALVSPSPTAAQGDAPLSIRLETPMNVPLEGQLVKVAVLYRGDEAYPIGGFDLSLMIDPQLATFDHAVPGDLFAQCGWEIFQSSLDSNNVIRLVGVADKGSTPYLPNCYMTSGVEDTLAFIFFRAVDDVAFACLFAHLQYFWTDCGDNSLSSATGDSLFVESSLYSLDSYQYIPFPESLGTVEGLPESCVGSSLNTLRLIDFTTGGFDYTCLDSINDRGDINLNGIAYEVADWVLFANYFLYGLQVFDPNPNFQSVQINATDINNDGEVLSIRDLAYLLRIIVGDAVPYPKPLPGDYPTEVAFFQVDTVNQEITFSYPENLCIIFFEFDGVVSVTSTDPALTVSYVETDGHTWVIAYSLDLPSPDVIQPGTVFNYSGAGGLIEVQAADWEDRIVNVLVAAPPACADADGDGIISISDPLAVINYIFAGGTLANPAAGDFNCSGTVNITDAVAMIHFMFSGGPPCSECP